MKSLRLSFLLGFFLTLASVLYWQKEGVRGLIAAMEGKTRLVSFWLETKNLSPRVLSSSNGSPLEDEKELKGKILAYGAFVYDLTQKRILYQLNPYRRLAAASTIKIVTAAVALNKGKIDEQITVNYLPTIIGESSMNLTFGEKLTLKELLYGLLLVSGNDAAETIAQGLAGNREVFVGWMNDYAKKIGARNTRFTTPSGLDEEGQYTTAYDLFLLGKNIFEQYPLIRDISVLKEKILPKTAGHRSYSLRNNLLVLDSFPIKAAKPGTGEGNLFSLVALLEKDNRQILVSLIRTPSLRHDLEQIINLF